MTLKLKIIFIIFVSSLLSYSIINNNIIEITLLQYFFIELTITLVHFIHNYVKKSLIPKI
jgi:hypothetical protein